MLLIILVALILAVLLFGKSPVLSVLSTVAIIGFGVIIGAIAWPEGGFDMIDLAIGGAVLVGLAIYVALAARG